MIIFHLATLFLTFCFISSEVFYMFRSDPTLWCFPSSVNTFMFEDSIDFWVLLKIKRQLSVFFFNAALKGITVFTDLQAETVQFHWKLPDLISPSFFFFPHSPFLLLSTVWGLHPRQQWNHLVSRLSRLLSTQPELYMDNRDLSWQRLAQTLCQRMTQSNFHSHTVSFGLSERPFFYFAEPAVFQRLEGLPWGCVTIGWLSTEVPLFGWAPALNRHSPICRISLDECSY